MPTIPPTEVVVTFTADTSEVQRAFARAGTSLTFFRPSTARRHRETVAAATRRTRQAELDAAAVGYPKTRNGKHRAATALVRPFDVLVYRAEVAHLMGEVAR